METLELMHMFKYSNPLTTNFVGYLSPGRIGIFHKTDQELKQSRPLVARCVMSSNHSYKLGYGSFGTFSEIRTNKLLTQYSCLKN